MTSSFDVIIIGGGAIGAACARELARERRRVLILDRADESGTAWRAAAGMLAPQIESDDNESLYELGVASRDRYAVLEGELHEATSVDMYKKAALVIGRDLFWLDLERLHTVNHDGRNFNAESLSHRL